MLNANKILRQSTLCEKVQVESRILDCADSTKSGAIMALVTL